MDDFAKNILNATDNRKQGADIADAIGMPDEQDYETLLKIVQKFERQNPGLINYALQAGRRDYETGVHRRKQIFTGKATVNKASNMVYAMELPGDLYQAIEAVFPSMFKSRRHFAWFKKNFPRMTISGDGK